MENFIKSELVSKNSKELDEKIQEELENKEERSIASLYESTEGNDRTGSD